MKTISHRGNISGPNQMLENNPIHIEKLLKANVDVEVDVWVVDSVLFLGHDNPVYVVNDKFINLDGLWCHAKNLDALHYMMKYNIKNYFWHQEDDFTLTSSGFIWTYPDKKTCEQSIIVDITPDWKNKGYDCFGVCVDYL